MKRLSLFIILLITCPIILKGQIPAPSSKQQQLTEAEKRLGDAKKRLAEIDARLQELLTLKAQQEALVKEIEQQQQLTEKLADEIQLEEEEKAFQESPARTVLDVNGLDSFLLDFNGTSRWVSLHGVKAKTYEVPIATIKAYRKRLVKKKLFVRCADAECNKVYLYDVKTNPTLNALLIINNIALATEDALFDVVAYVPRSTSNTPSSTGSRAGTDVSVHGYYRKDGTYVRPHTRSAPGRKR